MRTVVTAVLVGCLVSPSYFLGATVPEAINTPWLRIAEMQVRYLREALAMNQEFTAALAGALSAERVFNGRLNGDDGIRDLVRRWEDELTSANLRTFEVDDLESHIVDTTSDIRRSGSLYNAVFDSNSALSEIRTDVASLVDASHVEPTLVEKIQASMDWHTTTVNDVSAFTDSAFLRQVRPILNDAFTELKNLKDFVSSGNNPSLQAQLWRHYRDIASRDYDTLNSRFFRDFAIDPTNTDVLPRASGLQSVHPINDLLQEWAAALSAQGIVATDLREQLSDQFTKYENLIQAYSLIRESYHQVFQVYTTDQSSILPAALQWHAGQIDILSRRSESSLLTAYSRVRSGLWRLNQFQSLKSSSGTPPQPNPASPEEDNTDVAPHIEEVAVNVSQAADAIVHQESPSEDVRGHASSSEDVRGHASSSGGTSSTPSPTREKKKKKSAHGTQVPSVIADSKVLSTPSKMTPGVIVAIVVSCVIAAGAGLLFVMRGRIF